MTSKRTKSKSVRKGRKGSSNLTVVKQLGGVSDRQRVRLKYTNITAVTTIVTTGAFDYVYRGNSVFDPDFTATGGQPANFDDFAALFNQYRVFGSSIRVHLLTTLASSEPIMWVIGPRHTSTGVTYATQMDFAAQPYTRKYLSCIYRTGAPEATFNMGMSTAKFQGLSATEFMGRDDLTALVSTNPAEQWYWHVSGTNVDITSTSEIAIMTEVTYDVEFFDRIDTTLDLTAKIARMIALVPKRVASSGRSSGSMLADPSAYSQHLGQKERELSLDAPPTLQSTDKKSRVRDDVSEASVESYIAVTPPSAAIQGQGASQRHLPATAVSSTVRSKGRLP